MTETCILSWPTSKWKGRNRACTKSLTKKLNERISEQANVVLEEIVELVEKKLDEKLDPVISKLDGIMKGVEALQQENTIGAEQSALSRKRGSGYADTVERWGAGRNSAYGHL